MLATFSRSEWQQLGLISGESDYIGSHERLLRSLDFNDEDYDGHALRAIKRIAEGKGGAWAFLQIPQLRDWLTQERPAILTALERLSTQIPPQLISKARQLLVLAEGIKQTFNEGDWLKLGIIASFADVIEHHPRLLRSLRFGDSDYEGCIMEILGLMEKQRKPVQEILGGFRSLRDWLFENHSDVAQSLLESTDRATTNVPQSNFGNQQFPMTSPGVTQAPPSLFGPAPWEPMQLSSTEPPLFSLLAAVQAVPVGAESATAYHRAVEQLLSTLFTPGLSEPSIEDRLHEGRKRVDITYVNRDAHGFFRWITDHYPPAPYIYVECKNYSADPGNPELDQLAGRFSPKRGRVGLLICRNFTNKDLFIKRCRDSALDDRGFVIPLDDSDLADLVTAKLHEGDDGVVRLLRSRWARLVK